MSPSFASWPAQNTEFLVLAKHARFKAESPSVIPSRARAWAASSLTFSSGSFCSTQCRGSVADFSFLNPRISAAKERARLGSEESSNSKIWGVVVPKPISLNCDSCRCQEGGGTTQSSAKIVAAARTAKEIADSLLVIFVRSYGIGDPLWMQKYSLFKIFP